MAPADLINPSRHKATEDRMIQAVYRTMNHAIAYSDPNVSGRWASSVINKDSFDDAKSKPLRIEYQSSTITEFVLLAFRVCYSNHYDISVTSVYLWSLSATGSGRPSIGDMCLSAQMNWINRDNKPLAGASFILTWFIEVRGIDCDWKSHQF